MYCSQHKNLAFDIRFKNFQRLTTVDVTKFRKPNIFLQSFAVDTVDIKDILILKYAFKMFKDLVLLMPLTLLTTWKSCS